jgi:hypothetical protein
MYVRVAWARGGCTVLHVCVMYVVVTGNLSVCESGRVRRGPVPGETGYDGDRCERGRAFYCKLQHPPPVCGAYGSSLLPTGPHTDGTCIQGHSISTGTER